MADHRVFVYGSLKAGQGNHHWLEGAEFLGRRRLPGAVLHELDGFPMALLRQGEDGVVHGELYHVDAAVLGRLDQLEDYPHLYERSLCVLSGGERAWIYHGRPEQVWGTVRVLQGDWRSTPVFHYGANLDPDRLGRRCPGWDGLGLVVWLECCAAIRSDPEGRTWGVLTHLGREDLAELDRGEGVREGHCVRTVVVVNSPCGARFEAHAYVPGAAFRREGLPADGEYSAHVFAGMEYWYLPAAWRGHWAAALKDETGHAR